MITNKKLNYPVLLCKIGNKKHIEELQKGKVFMKNLEFHRNNAQKYPNKNLGDNEEAILTKNAEGSIIINNEEVAKAYTTCYLSSKEPVFCAMVINLSNQNFKPDIKLKNDFIDGNIENYSVFITPLETFINRCKNFFYSENLESYYEPIVYKDDLVIEYPYKAVFRKRLKFSYQNEYRILIKNIKIDINAHYEFNIGDLTNESEIWDITTFFNTTFCFKEKQRVV